MIEAKGLTRRYGDKIAVEDLTFTVRPGVVTGFLGPNGAGKSTTMRLALGLSTRGAPRTTTCWHWRRPTACRAAGCST
jgi:ABC-2 type transport system ATP-binding protein